MDSGHGALALSERKYQAVWEYAADAMMFLDQDGVLDCNETGLRLFGLAEREAVLGRPLADLAPPTQPHGAPSGAYLAAHVAATLNSGQSRFECQLRRGDGSLFVADVRLHRIDIGGGNAAHAVLRDITGRWNMEQSLRSTKDAIEASLHHLTYFDSVTGLPNRSHLYEHTPAALAAAAAAGRPVALCCVAIDDLERIGNSLGRDAGDAVLEEVAARLRAAVQEADRVARIGDHLFCVVLDGCTAEGARRAAQALQQAVAAPIRLHGDELSVAAAIGVSLSGTDGYELWTLLQNAEAAMYGVRSSGADNCRIHGAADAGALERLVREHRLRRALDRRELLLHYQPLVAAGGIVGVEALVRWQHPERGLVAPADFIPLAEQSGLIVPVGAWILESACTQAQAWTQAGAGAAPLTVGVKVSPRQFRDAALPQRVAQALADCGLAPERLLLEFTEATLTEHADHSRRTLGALRDLGARVAVEHFGSGALPLAGLKRLPIQVLKLDKSFVRALGAGTDEAPIARAMVGLGREFGLEVVAEGVETPQERAALCACGCDTMQGFLFCAALPGHALPAMFGSALA